MAKEGGLYPPVIRGVQFLKNRANRTFKGRDRERYYRLKRLKQEWSDYRRDELGINQGN